MASYTNIWDTQGGVVLILTCECKQAAYTPILIKLVKVIRFMRTRGPAPHVALHKHIYGKRTTTLIILKS